MRSTLHSLCSLAAAALCAAPLAAQNLVANGGFEAGMSGWSVTGAPTGGTCRTNWNASNDGGTPGDFGIDPAPGTNCMGVGGPYAGGLSAYNSFDGEGPLYYRLTQTFFMPPDVVSARLRFVETAWHEMQNPMSQSRSFDAFLIGAFGAEAPFSYVAMAAFGTIQGHGWTIHEYDLTAFSQAHAGTVVALVFDVQVPEYLTGPAGIGLDEVSFDVEVLDAGVVPEPASIVLLASGLLGLGVAVRRRAS